jgi:PadR family transcriptional regulator PadR
MRVARSRELVAQGRPAAVVARVAGISRQAIYRRLKRPPAGQRQQSLTISQQQLEDRNRLTLFRVLPIICATVVRKRSHETKLVLRMLLDAPTEETYGLAVVRATGLPAGSAYAILRRLEDDGLLDSRWEELDSAQAGRPLRRYYRLNGHGRRVAHCETDTDRCALRSLAPGWEAR